MGRHLNINETDKLSVAVNVVQVEYLKQVVELGIASTVAGAALYIVQRGIDDMMRSGILSRVNVSKEK